MGTRLSRGASGMRGAGSPCGNGPRTETPARAARSSTATAMVAAATAISMPGRRGHRFSTRISTRALPPIASTVTLVLPSHTFSMIPSICRSGPSALTEKPKSFGIWLRITVRAMPFM